MQLVWLGLAVVLLATTVCYAGNFVNDPGFELSSPNGTFPNSGYWQQSWAPSTAGAVCTTTAAHNGANGLWEYTGNESGAWWSGPYQKFPAQAGDMFSAKGWGRAPSGQPWVSGSKALIRIQFLDASDSLIQQYDSNAVTSADSSWQSLTVDAPAAPNGTAYVRFVFYLEKPQIVGQSVANFDDAVLSGVQVPQLLVSQGALGFGETNTALTFTIKNSGVGALNWSTVKSADWLTITPTSGTTTTETDTVTVNVSRAGLLLERYHTTLQITSNGGSKDIDIYLETPRSYTVPNQPSFVYLNGKTLYVERRLPNGSLDFGQRFVVKGTAWSPASIGTLRDLYWRQKEFSEWYTLDIPMIRGMNANTVYTFIDFGTDATAFSVLDELYKNDIYAIVTVDWDGTNDTNHIQTIVNAYKNHPAVLMWAIGNEWNINLYHNKFTTIDQAAAATQSAAQLIKSLDTGHPVASIYGEIEILPDQPLSKTQQIVSVVCTAVDIWGLNIYRGDNFGTLFTQWASITTKPMFLSEFGADSYFSIAWYPVVGYENETAQKNYLSKQWQNIVPELSALDPTKVCLGGTVFEWVDEWWKVLAQDGGSPNVQDNGGFPTYWNPIAQPDGFANEEYFGIVKIDRTAKEVYGTLQQAFQSAETTGPSLSITSHSNNQHITTSSITLSGTASDSGKGDDGIQQVTVNGERAINDTTTGSGTVNWSKQISVNSGANSITVVAYDNSTNHNQTFQNLTIYYDAATVNCPGDSLQAAVEAGKPGDIIYVNGTCNENILIRNEKQRLTLDGQNVATINGPNSGSPTLNVRGKGIVIQNFEITGGSDGINVNRGSNAQIIHNNIHNTGEHGIVIDQLAFSVIKNNSIHDNPWDGILVSENSIARIGFDSDSDSTANSNTIQSNGGNGITVLGTSNARIVGNTIANNTGDGIGVFGHSQADIASNAINNNGGNGISVSEKSGIQLGEDNPTTFFGQPNTTTVNNVGNGIGCSGGSYVSGHLGSSNQINGTTGQTNISATCPLNLATP